LPGQDTRVMEEERERLVVAFEQATRDELTATQSATPFDLAAPQRGARFGDYVILEQLGSGATGRVFRALHPRLDRFVALKLIALPVLHEARQVTGLRVLRESRALARLRHPNVVTVHDVGEADGYAYVAMELVEGSTLRGCRATPRPASAMLAMLVHAGRGLAAVHRAGFVHRDFKPDNVLVSTLGEVRVSDFGLARLIDEPPDHDGADDVRARLASDARLSQTGVAVGTLPYMAPEVLAGARATVASDQFSFCVTAFECLYGHLPFDGATPEVLLANIDAARIWRVPASLRLRASSHRLLLRGLAAAPGDRHASLEVLLDQLTPIWRRRLPWLLTAGVAAAAAGGLVLNRASTPDVRRCDDTASWHGVWDDAQRARVHQAFARTGLPYAEQAFQQVRAALDRYTMTWSDHQRQSCLVASVSDSPDPRYQLTCLRQRREDVTLLADKLAHADASVVPIAARLSTALRPTARCQLDPDAVPRRPLADPHDAASAHLQISLAAAGIAHRVGDLAQAERLSREVLAGATELDVPLVSEARLLLGNVLVELQREGDDETALFRAATDAESAGLYALAAEGWLGLAEVTRGRPNGDPARWLALADIAVKRAGNPPDLAAMWTSQRAFQLVWEGNFTGALALQEQAAHLLAAQYGADDLRVATSNYRLAKSLGMIGHFDDAVPLLRAVVAARARALSPTHPDTLDAQETLGICLHRSGRPAEALPLLEHCLSAREALVGPSSPALAGPLGNLAGALSELHRQGEALSLLERAVAIREAAYGANDQRVAIPLVNVGTVLVAMGRQAEAIPVLRRARDLFLTGPGAGPLDSGYARVQLAEALSQLGRHDEALVELDPLERLPPDQYARLAASALVARGTALIGLGDASAAEKVFERAADLPDDERISPEIRRQIADGLARARRSAGPRVPKHGVTR
jgi:eukaryotic-like serine/threonine-protein kinase